MCLTLLIFVSIFHIRVCWLTVFNVVVMFCISCEFSPTLWT
ncbi:hypothetical protein KSS87_007416 [Heliosperma pusillum]|nr:hypothetical protein KSS87_007416 [Heliosperma pusillum]